MENDSLEQSRTLSSHYCENSEHFLSLIQIVLTQQ